MTIGVLGFTDAASGDELVAFVRRLETQGYDSFWVPEIYGREGLSTCAFLLANTERIRIATGIANVYARDAVTAENGRRTLAEFSGGRFEMGLGVSHANLNAARGHEWIPPSRKLRSYVEAMREAPADSPEPVVPAPIVLAAHGPKLMALAEEVADGCLTYLSPPPRTELARKLLGPEKTVRPVIAACLCDDIEVGRAAAREALGFYFALPAYYKIWEACGFTPDDWEGLPSDRLIDALCACGDRGRIEKCVEEHLAAGADQVLIYPVSAPGARPLGGDLFDALAPGAG